MNESVRIEALNREIQLLKSRSTVFLDEPASPYIDAVWINRITKEIKIWDGKNWV